MSFKLVLFLLAALHLVSSSSVSARMWDDEQLRPRRPGNSNRLVLTLPPGNCWPENGDGSFTNCPKIHRRNIHKPNFPPSNFFIHGLWPVDNSDGKQWNGLSHRIYDELDESVIRQMVSARTWDDEKQPGPPGSPKFSNWLVLTWTPGYCWRPTREPKACRNINRNSPPSKFFIHGLWPINNTNGRSWPSRAYEELNIRDRTVIGDIRRMLQQNRTLWNDINESWPTLNFTDNVTFWMNEWNKHGSFIPQQGQPTLQEAAYYYFQRTVGIGKDWADWLDRIPRNYDWYNRLKFINAIERQPRSYTVGLACNQYKKTYNNNYYELLSEVLICIGANCGKQPDYIDRRPCNGTKIRFGP
ncbi:hypothetical protein EZV62_026864 [Acer yangbiense]|uniref:Uncharacterized protein n=1 Tax=Acer yangbiense TaxID=1000413 RepID=A0A5C7GSP8_9ROSI|nr:hypothetical protein EZV62_026864 [Acer yangbiense]